ncbi:flagellar basal body rod protein FlgB [Roseimaritima sediminicola]|uniref:flagellar basal body rod protein FlgB n=1 Tax=Roseimaritima sediminicola TaxID=2662066 RepID=UPI00129851FC|nr:flagellar basal body rod protein FlgB [Roseimaritima sediminicola]
MLDLFSSTAIPALEQSAVFAQRRHQVLAGNLANLDTPNYRSRDLSVDAFQNALANSIQQTQSPSASRSPGHAGTVKPAFGDGPRAAMQEVVYHDGSDVGMEHQVTQIAKNQHMHNLAIALMRNQFGVLQAAISERV